MGETDPLAPSSSDQQEGDVESAADQPSRQPISIQLRKAKKECSGPMDFMKKSTFIVVDSVGFVIIVAVLLVVPISMIVIGASNLHNCPAEDYIPIWLVTSGSVLAFLQLVYIGNSMEDRIRKRKIDENTITCHYCFNFLITCFKIIWFILGNVWVFKIYAPNTILETQPDYCNGLVYYFSFWLIMATYIWMIVMCCCGACLSCGVLYIFS